MKKIFVLVFTVILVLSLVACSSSSEPATTPAPTPTVEAEKAAAEPEQKETASEKTEDAVALNPDGAYNVVLVDSGTDSLKVLTAVRDALGLDLMGAKDLVNNVPAVLKQQLTLTEAEALKATIEEKGATVELQETEKIAEAPAATGDSVVVVLTDAGSAKLNVVKEIKNQLELGLTEAKALVDNIPSTLAENISIEEAEALKAVLEEVGATVEIQK